ncbi:MAG: hypothetical protein U0798_05780 [Gemmataceae bacterium]
MGALLVYDRELTAAEELQTIQYLEGIYLAPVPEPSSMIVFSCFAVAAYGVRRNVIKKKNSVPVPV